MSQLFSGINSVLNAAASNGTYAQPKSAVAYFRSLEVDVKGDVKEAGDSTSAGYMGAYGGQKEFDATLLLHVPFAAALNSGVAGTVAAFGTGALTNVRKITRHYTSSVVKGADSSSAGWKRVAAGMISWGVTIECYAPAGSFNANAVEAATTVALTATATAIDTGIVGNVAISRIGGFKAGPEAGMIGFTVEGKGHLEATDDTLLTALGIWLPNALLDFELLATGGASPSVHGTVMVQSIDDFVVDVEGGDVQGVSIKLAGDGGFGQANIIGGIMSVSELTAALTEFESKGKKFTLYPLRFRNWGELERWIRDDIVFRAKRVMVTQDRLGDMALLSSQRDTIMSAAFKEAGEVNIIDAISSSRSYLTTFEGMLRIVCQSIGNGEKNEKLRLSLDDVDELFGGNIDLLTAVYVRVIQISYPERDFSPKKVAPPVNPPLAP